MGEPLLWKSGRYFFVLFVANRPKADMPVTDRSGGKRVKIPWQDFMEKLDRLHVKFGATIPMELEYNKDEDSGKDF